MKEVHGLKHEEVSDKRVKHILTDNMKLDTKIHVRDTFMNIGIRLGFNRFDYKVPPGLYCIGTPTEDDDVIVTCNYKLTVDIVRKELESMNIWLLVLDTAGVNVWCAAGKGSFGTAELVYSIEKADLKNKVNHKRLILPQLGGPGIQSHLIKETTGFSVTYGPVRISDMKSFMDQGYKADEKMRTVEFGLFDRVKVTYLEMITAVKYLIILFVIPLLASLVMKDIGLKEVFAFAGIYSIGTFTGALLIPIVLPIMPFRMFYKNGILVSGLLLVAYMYFFNMISVFSIGNSLIAISVAGYVAMNFTGSTTFTSLSGVKKEMEQAIPILGGILLIGSIVTVVGVFVEVLS